MTEARDFWSRRKAQVAAETEAEEVARERIKTEADHAGKTDAEILAELDLPDPEEMGEGDDFSAFMIKAVPDRLRLKALRKLWLTNPVLANVDGLVDYGEDFTDAACVIENLQSSYQVGKGMRAHIEEMARQAQAEADRAEMDHVAGEGAEDEEIEASQGDPEALPTDAPGAAQDEIAAPETTSEPLPDDPVGDTLADGMAAPTRRRMRFSFDGGHCDGRSGEMTQA